MRVLLIHNPKAGDREYSKKQLVASLSTLGHETVYQSIKKLGWKKAFDRSRDLVIAAGGDGTVRKVAWQLMDTGVPLVILPLGTANNLARSLGFMAPPDEIIAHLGDGKARPFDVGISQAACGKELFVEAAGGGLLADFLKEAEGRGDKDGSRKQRMKQHVARLRKISTQYPAQHWDIRIDGEDVSDRYLLWEAMNIRSAGPALNLAPRAATDDGMIDFVSVRENERDIFVEYLNARVSGDTPRFPLPARTIRHLRIVERAASMHLDDKVWPEKKAMRKCRGPIEITVRPAALMVCGPTL